MRRDFGTNSVVGVTLTDRERGGAYNRVAAADTRVVFGQLYFFEAQLGASWTREREADVLAPGRTAPRVRSDPVWRATLDRTGKLYGFNFQVTGFGRDFRTDAGFAPRTGVVSGHAANRLRWTGARGALLEEVTLFLNPSWVWAYDDFARRGAAEGTTELSTTWRFRKGWQLQANAGRQFYTLDPGAYAGYEVPGTTPGDLDPYVPADALRGLATSTVQVTTPVFQAVTATVRLQRNEVPVFAEGSEGRDTRATLVLSLRPTRAVRVDGTATYSRITRARDGSEFARTVIPRLKAEYQLTRALFFRAVGEYRSDRQGVLLDPRTGEPLLVGGGTVSARERGGLQLDWLASYEPTPGTVAYLGYGSSHASPYATGFGDFRRAADGLFLKLAYQFRR